MNTSYYLGLDRRHHQDQHAWITRLVLTKNWDMNELQHLVSELAVSVRETVLSTGQKKMTL